MAGFIGCYFLNIMILLINNFFASLPQIHNKQMKLQTFGQFWIHFAHFGVIITHQLKKQGL